MTIIVTIKTDNKIIIGTDKRIIEGDTIISEDASKILINELTIERPDALVDYDEFIIAFSGLYSLYELLKTFNPPRMSHKDTFQEYLYKRLIPDLNKHLKEYNFIQDYNGQSGVDWELIIAYHNQLFLVEYNLGICEIDTPYYAVGAPRDIALGSLYTSNLKEHPVEINMVKTAIQACAAHNTTCNNEIEIYSIHETGQITKIM